MLILIPRGPGGPPRVRIDRRSATIGRDAGVDLSLPDTNRVVSAKHCRIDYRDGRYVLTDTSTNGTAVNGRPLTAPHPLAEDDVLTIGPWQIAVSFAADLPGRVTPAINPEPRAAAAPPPEATMQQPSQQASPAPSLRPPPPGDAVGQLFHAAGIPRSAIAAPDVAVMAAAGALLRQFCGGLMVLLEARAKARDEMGVKPPAPTHNPLKKQAKAEPALAQLLGAPQPGERAVAEAFAELDAHQRATLKAMQGALCATLDELAPEALRRSHPSATDAQLWQAYDKAFSGQTGDSFIEVFAGKLGSSYEKLAASG